jgi:hypothetical protein
MKKTLATLMTAFLLVAALKGVGKGIGKASVATAKAGVKVVKVLVR